MDIKPGENSITYLSETNNTTKSYLFSFYTKHRSTEKGNIKSIITQMKNFN